MSDSSNVLITETQLASRWSISVKTLRNRRATGGGPAFVKLGRSVRYRIDDIVRFEEAGIRLNTSESGRLVR